MKQARLRPIRCYPAAMQQGLRSVLEVLLGALALGVCIHSSTPASRAQASPPSLREQAGHGALQGRPLSEALRYLQSRGLKVVFTSNVVRPEMKVAAPPPESDDLRALLDALLAPHGLESRDAPNDTVVVVPRRSVPDAPKASTTSISGYVRALRDTEPVGEAAIRVLERGIETTSAPDGSFVISDLESGSVTIEIRRRGFVVETFEHVAVAGQAAQLDILLESAPLTEETVLVRPSRVSLLRREPAAPVAVDRDTILALPHLGDDFFRALSLLPGIAANDASAQFSIRGGRQDETRIVLDGQELYETYHLKDFDSAQSIIAPATLASVDLSTGSFSAEHGDRMGGVLDMTTRTPTESSQLRLGIGILGTEAGGAARFADGRGSWIGQARRGSNDFAGKLIGPERPLFWDIFAKVDLQATPRHQVRVNLLNSNDEFDFAEVTIDGEKRLATEYSSSYLWLTDRFAVGPRLFFETALSQSRIERDRTGLELDEDVQWVISDRRDLDVVALRQSWHFQPNPRHFLGWGFELRDFETVYDYSSSFNFDVPLAQIRTNADLDAINFAATLDDSHNSLYLTDRLQFGEATSLEVGLRFDEHSPTRESHLTPRINLAHSIGAGTVVRAAWGRFNQSQRPYELAVEDGDTEFRRVERSEHRLLGFERAFASPTGAGLTLRVEAYQRDIRHPQPRWSNLYEPLNEFQEVEPDRVRITPDRSHAGGLEVFLRGRTGGRVDWFVNYALASTEDEIDGLSQPRALDQTHSLNLDLNYRINDAWTLNLAWRYHTGWPTTPLGLEPVVEFDDPEGEPEGEEDGEPGEVDDAEPQIRFLPVLGLPFSDRLSDYHRLDLRASRRWQRKSGLLTFFVDIQNVYDRKNLAGFDFEIDEEQGVIVPNPETWRGFFPSLGLRWQS